MADETYGSAAFNLSVAAAERQSALEKVRAIQREAQEAHEEARSRAKAMHREANEKLVSAIDEARAAGLRLSEITARIGLSVQTINHLRRLVAKTDNDQRETTT